MPIYSYSACCCSSYSHCSARTIHSDCNSFACFYVIYNISLPIMALCLLTRGVLAVEHATPNRIVDATISGIAGLSHIGLAVALILLFVAIKRRMPVESSDQQDCTAHRS